MTFGPLGHRPSTAIHPRARAIRRALVQQRDGEWALIGFRNLEPEGIFAFEILDPMPLLQDGSLVAALSADVRTSHWSTRSNQYQAVGLRAVAERATITPEGPTVEEDAT